MGSCRHNIFTPYECISCELYNLSYILNNIRIVNIYIQAKLYWMNISIYASLFLINISTFYILYIYIYCIGIYKIIYITVYR